MEKKINLGGVHIEYTVGDELIELNRVFVEEKNRRKGWVRIAVKEWLEMVREHGKDVVLSVMPDMDKGQKNDDELDRLYESLRRLFRSVGFVSDEEYRNEMRFSFNRKEVLVAEKRNHDWLIYVKGDKEIWECGPSVRSGVRKMSERLGKKSFTLMIDVEVKEESVGDMLKSYGYSSGEDLVNEIKRVVSENRKVRGKMEVDIMDFLKDGGKSMWRISEKFFEKYDPGKFGLKLMEMRDSGKLKSNIDEDGVEPFDAVFEIA